MSYVIATTGDKVRWYVFDVRQRPVLGEFQVAETLDLALVPLFETKAAASQAARALGLTTWRYVRL